MDIYPTILMNICYTLLESIYNLLWCFEQFSKTTSMFTSTSNTKPNQSKTIHNCLPLFVGKSYHLLDFHLFYTILLKSAYDFTPTFPWNLSSWIKYLNKVYTFKIEYLKATTKHLQLILIFSWHLKCFWKLTKNVFWFNFKY